MRVSEIDHKQIVGVAEWDTYDGQSGDVFCSKCGQRVTYGTHVCPAELWTWNIRDDDPEHPPFRGFGWEDPRDR